MKYQCQTIAIAILFAISILYTARHTNADAQQPEHKAEENQIENNTGETPIPPSWTQSLPDKIITLLQNDIKNNPHPNSYIALAKILQNRNDYETSRQILLDAEKNFFNNTDIVNAYSDNLKQDPTFITEPRQIMPKTDVTSIQLLGGGSTLVFKAIKNSEPVAAFKPHQTRHQSNYRSEIAAYRLALLIKARFNIPYNEHAYFEYNDFLNLYKRYKSNPAHAETLKDLITKKQDGKDYLHGTYKEWIPDFTEFPIELSSNWKPWLKIETDPQILDEPAADIIPNIKKRHSLGEKLAPRLQKHLGELTKKQLALQLSNLIVFDFLVNNWDRFSGVPRFWGINCQIKDKKFMSIDNGASFPKTPNEKPLKHLKDTQRFSRITLRAIQKLDRDETLNILLPHPTPFEVEKFDTFWKQREIFLQYIDDLVIEYGADNVLFFD